MALTGVVLSGWMIAASFIISPFLVVLNFLFEQESFELFNLFFTIGLCGLGLFITMGMIFVTRVVTKGFFRYLQYNVNVVKG